MTNGNDIANVKAVTQAIKEEANTSVVGPVSSVRAAIATHLESLEAAGYVMIPKRVLDQFMYSEAHIRSSNQDDMEWARQVADRLNGDHYGDK